VFWFYLVLVLLIELPAVFTGIGGVRRGWEMWGATQAATPIVWAVASAAAPQLARNMKPGAWKVFTRTLLIALALIGAVFGQVLALFSGIAFNYGATETDLAIGFIQFFALGAAVALAPSALIGGLAVLFAKASARAHPTTSPSQEN
jgi:hypothetical protein